MPYFQYNNSKKIYYTIKRSTNNQDKSSALIFIHGSGGNSNNWKNQLNSLTINLDLIAIDLPSHLNSDEFDGLSLELYVGVLEELIDTLKRDKVILCGHSLGGAIIQSFYFKNPNKVLGLILVGSGARLRVSPMILNSLANDYQKYLDELPSGAFYRKTSLEIINEVVEESSKVPAPVTLSDFRICDAFDTLNKTESINVPCLIICGNQDRLTPAKYSMYFHEKIKTSELALIDGAGHFVMLEKPNEVNKAIESFLKKYY